ncbi:MAG: type I restriction enzyme HsdR N-terminal domain-containing protein [Chloroflexota bacterium]|nr:type I restriction enzyme HsdR N-terminal domain-containing protein [Chloroflexota bacterium]
MSLKDIPESFNIDSEEDLRFFIANYFLELGFDTNEFSFEDTFSIQLGHNSIIVGKEDSERKTSGGRSDILVTRNGNPIILIETKKPDHKLTNEDAQQAISYARLTSQITPFALLTNGKDTKVYDVLKPSITNIDSPKDSLWAKNGQKLSGLYEELKTEAAQVIVGINSEILAQFCHKQVNSELKSLKSDVPGNKKFIPDVYIERIGLENSFNNWLDSERSIFALISPSGYGKTNFMCATAEKQQKNHFILFYSAKSLKRDIYSAIINDFIWEFIRSKNIAQIFQRFDSISARHKRNLIIFIDGLDEFSNQSNSLKNELLEISKRLPSYPNIRFVISCKSFDWPNFIIDHNQSYNLFAETIKPDLKNANLINNEVNPNKVGYQLGEFTSAELESAIERYRSAYKLNGEFRGDIKQESSNPLMLRFISEVYSKSGDKLPVNISSIELYEKYLKRKLSDVSSKNLSQILLTKVSEIIFNLDRRFFDQNFLYKEFEWNNEFDQSLEDLIRLGVLSQFIDNNNTFLGFEFHKFLLFYYIFKVIKISSLNLLIRRKKITNLLQSKIGREAIEFYLLVGKPLDISETLIDISNFDFPIFSSTLTSFSRLASHHKEPISSEAIQAFLDTYNHMRTKIFPNSKDMTLPYTGGLLGIILIKQSPVRFRGTTKSYPQQFVEVRDKKIISQVVKGPVSKGVLKELNPVGNIYIGGCHEFTKFPPLAAYNFFLKQLSNIVINKCLSEKNCNDLIQERAYDLLTLHPSIWTENDFFSSRKRYYELFGFESIDHLQDVKIKDIIVETEKHLNILSSEFSNTSYKGLKNMRFKELVSLLFSLKSLPDNSTLKAPKIKINDLFRYLKYKNIEEIVPVVNSLYQDIISNFKALFEVNFENLCPFSPLYINLDRLSFIEIVWPKNHFPTDYLTLSYVFSEKELSKKEPIIYTTDYSISKTIELLNANLFGTSRTRSDKGAGYIILDNNDFSFLDEPTRFWVSKTSFPSRQPIQNQVYKLINNELKLLLRPQNLTWGLDHFADSSVNDLYIRKCLTKYQKNFPINN